MNEQEIRIEQAVESIKQLIRYDIPILILGESSIGKSYTLNWLCDKYRIKRQMLFIGSEKAENIEGIPNIRKEGEKLTYFKPYWFPKIENINDIIQNGRDIFNKLVDPANGYVKEGDFSYTFPVLDDMLNSISDLKWGIVDTKKDALIRINTKYSTDTYLNSKPFILERSIATREEKEGEVLTRDDIRDICSYLSTLLGYGNFWLILDEIDKVEEGDTDKYAPLLHIVRERYLKGWNLVQINDKRGINVAEDVQNNSYVGIKEIIDRTIDNKQSLLDTRIVAIANETGNITDALFRRFVQLFIKDVLIKDIPPPVANKLRACMVKNEVTGMVEYTEEQAEAWMSNTNPGFIHEINLQWVFGFLPRMINKNDILGNFFIQDILRIVNDDGTIKGLKPGSEQYNDRFKDLLESKSAIYRILTSNFQSEDRTLEGNILSCLIPFLEPGHVEAEDEYASKRKALAEYFDLLSGSEKDVAVAILKSLKDQAPDKKPNASDVNSNIASMQAWVKNCYDYIYITMYNKDGEFKQTGLNKILIPKIQALVLSEMSANPNIPQTIVIELLKQTGEFWAKVKSEFKNMKADVAAFKEARDQVYGAKDEVKPDSASFNLIGKSMSACLAEIAGLVNLDKLSLIRTSVGDEGMYNFIKAYWMDGTVNMLVEGAKKSTDANIKIYGKKVETFFA